MQTALRLANYLAFAGIPHRAARVMEKAMKEGQIESNAANYKTLANYWHQAKELDPAIDTLAKSYKLAPNAELQLKMARMMIQSKRTLPPDVITDESRPMKELLARAR